MKINTKNNYIIVCTIIIIIFLTIGVSFNRNIILSKSNNDSVANISFYLESIDISTFDNINIIYINNKNDIFKILLLLEKQKDIKKSRENKYKDNFVQNNPSGYVEVIYDDNSSDKLYFSENKKRYIDFTRAFLVTYVFMGTMIYYMNFWKHCVISNNTRG